MCQVAPDGTILNCRHEAEGIFTSCRFTPNAMPMHISKRLLDLERQHGPLPAIFKGRVANLVQDLIEGRELLTKWMTPQEVRRTLINDNIIDMMLGMSGKRIISIVRT